MALSGVPEILRLRRSLLLIAGAVGSVSASTAALSEVRNAVELFGCPAGMTQGWSRARTCVRAAIRSLHHLAVVARPFDARGQYIRVATRPRSS